MSRVKRGVTKHIRHKKVLKAAKGYYGRRKNTIRAANQAVERGGSTLIETGERRNVFFGLCGYRG